MILDPRALWSIDSIAEYAGLSPKQIANRIAVLPDFPPGIAIEQARIPGRYADAVDIRWVAGEVMEWFEAQRERRKDQRPPVSPGRTALYRHFDINESLLYVGISLNPFARLSAHMACSPWARDISRITIAWFDTRSLAISAELSAIEIEKPRFNIVGRVELGFDVDA